MTVDPAVLPGLLLLAAELIALAAVGFIVVRVALRQTDDRMALAQGLVVGPALWGVIVSLVMYAVPGLMGALVGWVITLALGAGLAWRKPHAQRPRLSTLAGFAVAIMALFGVALISRQQLGITDAATHLGLAASLRAGVFPPELPWNPGMPVPYHYGIDLLIGLLAPPVGPDLAFVTELLGAYAWTSFVLVVVSALLRRASGFAVLVTAPLLLTAGAWTLEFAPSSSVLQMFVPAGVPTAGLRPAVTDVLQMPVPAGIPAAGLRASLTDIYLPWLQLPSPGGHDAALSNVWKPVFTLSYALAFVVLERIAVGIDRRWPATLTLAGLVGFVGLLTTTLAPMVLVMWAGLEAVHLAQARRAGAASRAALLRAGAGLALAAVLMSVGGGALATFMAGSGQYGLSLRWSDDPGALQPLTSFDLRPGGVGLLGLGPLVVAGVAVLLAWRDRLVLALAVGACALVLASVALRYDPAPWDLSRFVGHARNFSLLALLLALSVRLAGLRPVRRRYAAGALLVVLITWPTVAQPVRSLGLAIGKGVQVANASAPQQGTDEDFRARYRLARLPSDGVAAYIRDRTAVDARVLSPHPASMTFATGRANASGFAQLLHLFAVKGPEYQDAIHYLEPAAIRRLGITYVHATDAWVAELPDRAARWLGDPRYFELLIRDGAEALYRVRPDFLRLNAAPAPASFEALRQAVPASAVVYLPAPFGSSAMFRVAWALSHTRLLSNVDVGLHLLKPIRVDPLGQHEPDLVVAPAQLVPWMFPPAGRQPIWWNDAFAVYAPNSIVAPVMPPPPQDAPPPVSVRVSDVRAADGRVSFTVTLDDREPERWTGQDWVAVATESSPWAIPLEILPDGRTPVGAAWFAGHFVPGAGTTTRTIEFDARASRLVVQDGHGGFTAAATSGSVQDLRAWTLAVRLQHEWRPNYWRLVAIIPVLQIEVSEAGEVSYWVYEDPLTVSPRS